MATTVRFPARIIAAIQKSASLRIRAGSVPHRFLGIWAVVVDDRVFIRSWNDKAAGWHRVWLADPGGAILVNEREVAVRAIPVRSERQRDAVSTAYLAKYWRPASLQYSRGLGEPKRRATTLELVPAAAPRATKPRAKRAPQRG